MRRRTERVAMVLYYLFSRSLDLSAEQEAIIRSRELLVGAA